MTCEMSRRVRAAWTTAIIALVVLMGVAIGAAPVEAQEPSPTFNLQYLLLQDAPGGVAVITDSTGVVRTGEFQAQGLYRRTSPTTAIVDYTVWFTDPGLNSFEFSFTALEALLVREGAPVGMILSGLGTAFRDDQEEVFPVTAKVHGDLTSTALQPLTWYIPDNPVDPGLRIDSYGRVKIQFHWDVD